MKTQPTVTVVIVNYNSGLYAKTCIQALLRQTDITLEIIVIDNNSIDDSVALLQQTFSTQIKLITSPENLGFGRANNLAAAQASGEYLLLLNPDTEMSNPKAISCLISFLSINPQYGMVGPAIFEAKRANGAGRYVKPRHTYPAQRLLKNQDKFLSLPGQLAWLLGACLLFKREVFQAIDGFDADYFLYGEDADIGLRLRQHGYEIGYCKAVEIAHIAGASEISAASDDKWLRKKRGLFLFFCKHYTNTDIVNICHIAKRKAALTMWTQKIILFFNPQHSKAQEKTSKAKAELVVANEVLTRLDS